MYLDGIFFMNFIAQPLQTNGEKEYNSKTNSNTSLIGLNNNV